MALLAVDRLSVSFPERERWVPVVRGLGLTIERGEVLGLVGESGCGKTVTASAVVGLVPPPGRVDFEGLSFDGRALAGNDELRRLRGDRIGFVFQHPAASLDPLFTIGAQLVETIRTHRPMDRRGALAETKSLLETVSLPDSERFLAAWPHELSGGELQRAAIALALAGKPQLLIADEPTSALDVTVQARILALLARLRDELELAVLVISHDLAVVGEICDRVIVLYAGEEVESGPSERVFDQPRHPYTRALLASAPVSSTSSRILEGIPGRLPKPGELPSGCAFHPRCSERREECSRELPGHRLVEADHRARCLLIDGPETTEGRA